MNLVKYCTADVAKNILARRKLRFTPPSEFNDPFEMHPHLGALLSSDTLSRIQRAMPESEWNKHIEEAMDNQIEKLPTESKALYRTEGMALALQQIANSPEMKELAVVLLQGILEQLNPQFSQGFIKGLRQSLGVLCLAGHPMSELMWAHYANAHTGACIIYHEHHDFFQQEHHPGYRLRRLTKVDYAQDRPIFDDLLGMIAEADDEERLYRKLFFTKSSVWDYEQEARCIRPLNEADETVTTSDGTTLHLFEFPADALQGVVFGARCSDRDIEDIISASDDLFADRSYPPFAKIALDEKRYQLLPVPILVK